MRSFASLALVALASASSTALATSDFVVSMDIVNNGGSVTLDPSVQHIPLDPALAHLRPPPARVPKNFDIFIGLSVFRDGYRCAKTMVTGFKRATHPERLFFGVVDQVNPGDQRCIEEYCKMAAAAFPDKGPCPYRKQIRMDEHRADDSRGPTLARFYQQQLVGDQEFCLQLDGHSIFTNKWDDSLIAEWTRIDNEMAVISTYLYNADDYVKESGENDPMIWSPHICTTIRGIGDMVRNEGASAIGGAKIPQMAALWGAGLSFSKCHAERRVLVDPHTPWLFDGEEFMRASHLWTYGYDIYSPTPLGVVIYHNYSSVPARFENVKYDEEKKAREAARARNRVRLMTGQDFVGDVDARELRKYGFGNVRSFDDYLAFSGVTFKEGEKDKNSCNQLRWVPYANATDVEELVGGGGKLIKQPVKPEPVAQQRRIDGAEAGPEAEFVVMAKAKKVGVPPAVGNGLGAFTFYFMIFGGCLYVVMANKGVRWRIANLWSPAKGHKKDIVAESA